MISKTEKISDANGYSLSISIPLSISVEDFINNINSIVSDIKSTRPEYTKISLLQEYDGSGNIYFYGTRPLTQKELEAIKAFESDGKKNRYEEYLKLKREFDTPNY